MIKIDLHIHTKEDQKDTYISYNAKKIIDEAQKQRFSAISITLHDKIFDDEKIKEYAEKKNILLIKGIEKTIQEKHVLVYVEIDKETLKINDFERLKEEKERKNLLVIAPHPFNPKIIKTCLRNKVIEHKDLFDAIEIQQLYTRIYNPNKKAKKVAKKLNKAIIANSDSHFIEDFGKHYTLLDLNKNFTEKDIIDAIKKKKTKIITKPLSIIKAIKYISRFKKK